MGAEMGAGSWAAIMFSWRARDWRMVADEVLHAIERVPLLGDWLGGLEGRYWFCWWASYPDEPRPTGREAWRQWRGLDD